MFQVFIPILMLCPTSSPEKARAAPAPTITSFFPSSNFRPCTMAISLLTSKAGTPTPRSGTFELVPVLRFGRSMMTNNSFEAMAPFAPRAIPGASLITRVSSRVKLLVISLSAPLRRMMAVSGAPEAVIALRKPCAMASTPTKTAATPAMPTAAETAAPFRSGRLRRLKSATAKT